MNFNLKSKLSNKVTSIVESVSRRTPKPSYEVSLWGWARTDGENISYVHHTILGHLRVSADFLPQVGDSMWISASDLSEYDLQDFEVGEGLRHFYGTNAEVIRISHGSNGGTTVWLDSEDELVQNDNRKYAHLGAGQIDDWYDLYEKSHDRLWGSRKLPTRQEHILASRIAERANN